MVLWLILVVTNELSTNELPGLRSPTDWVLEGGVVAAIQGGSAAVRAKVDALAAAGAPVAGVWVQDWVGRRVAQGQSRLWWNWVVDRATYPDWEDLVSWLWTNHSARMLTYVNPYLTDAPHADVNMYREVKKERASVGGGGDYCALSLATVSLA